MNVPFLIYTLYLYIYIRCVGQREEDLVLVVIAPPPLICLWNAEIALVVEGSHALYLLFLAGYPCNHFYVEDQSFIRYIFPEEFPL